MGIGETTALVAATALILSGCSAASLRGSPAETPEQCEADWQQERSRGRASLASNSNNAGAVIATIFVGAAINTGQKQAANDRLRDCLARFGIDDPVGYVREVQEGRGDVPVSDTPAEPVRSGFDRPTDAALAPRSTACPENASVLYGGTTYCTGR